jgi:hypothetical protein
MMMSKQSKRTRTITLSLNFNNENEYRFTFDIRRRKITWDQAEELTGKNCFREKFKLGSVGPAVMELLVELGHATGTLDPDYYMSVGPWNILAEPWGRPEAAWCTDVKYRRVWKDDPSAKVSVPAVGEATPDRLVSQVELSPKPEQNK